LFQHRHICFSPAKLARRRCALSDIRMQFIERPNTAVKSLQYCYTTTLPSNHYNRPQQRNTHVLATKSFVRSSAIAEASLSSASSRPVPCVVDGGRGNGRDGRMMLLLLLLLLLKMVLFAATRVDAEPSFDNLSTVNWHKTLLSANACALQ
jgi:hypothetical protein